MFSSARFRYRRNWWGPDKTSMKIASVFSSEGRVFKESEITSLDSYFLIGKFRKRNLSDGVSNKAWRWGRTSNCEAWGKPYPEQRYYLGFCGIYWTRRVNGGTVFQFIYRKRITRSHDPRNKGSYSSYRLGLLRNYNITFVIDSNPYSHRGSDQHCNEISLGYYANTKDARSEYKLQWRPGRSPPHSVLETEIRCTLTTSFNGITVQRGNSLI